MRFSPRSPVSCSSSGLAGDPLVGDGAAPTGATTPPPRAAAEIQAARDDANAAAAAVSDAETELDRLSDKADELHRQEAELQTQVDALQGAVDEIAVDRFVSSGAGSLALLEGPEASTDRSMSDEFASSIASTSTDTLDHYSRAQSDLEDVQAEVADNQAALERQRDAFEQAQQAAEAQVVHLQQVEAQRLEDERVRRILEAQRAEEARQAQAAADAAAAAAATAAATTPPPPSGGAAGRADSSGGATATPAAPRPAAPAPTANGGGSNGGDASNGGGSRRRLDSGGGSSSGGGSNSGSGSRQRWRRHQHAGDHQPAAGAAVVDGLPGLGLGGLQRHLRRGALGRAFARGRRHARLDGHAARRRRVRQRAVQADAARRQLGLALRQRRKPLLLRPPPRVRRFQPQRVPGRGDRLHGRHRQRQRHRAPALRGAPRRRGVGRPDGLRAPRRVLSVGSADAAPVRDTHRRCRPVAGGELAAGGVDVGAPVAPDGRLRAERHQPLAELAPPAPAVTRWSASPGSG